MFQHHVHRQCDVALDKMGLRPGNPLDQFRLRHRPLSHRRPQEVLGWAMIPTSPPEPVRRNVLHRDGSTARPTRVSGATLLHDYTGLSLPMRLRPSRSACCIARSFVTDFSVYFWSSEARFLTLPPHCRRAEPARGERTRAPTPRWSR